MQNQKTALVAFGANIPVGESLPNQTIYAAVSALCESGFTCLSVSHLYKTPCFPAGAGPDYVNAATLLRYPSEWTANDVLNHFHRVEADFGRKRALRWGMRTLDIDLIAIDDLILPDPATLRHWIDLPPEQQRISAPDQLILPHPRMQDRAFVLVPLAEIAPDWCHPLLNTSIHALLASLPVKDKEDVREIPDSGVVKPPHRA
jgi:2-amino-4-hydroxy-6-hydroxymethyldihydropteridine diphosphokinase